LGQRRLKLRAPKEQGEILSERPRGVSEKQKVIKNKLGLFKLVKTLGNVAKAYKVMGYSRDSFCRFKTLYEACPKNCVDQCVEEALIVAFAVEKSVYGKGHVPNKLRKRVISGYH